MGLKPVLDTKMTRNLHDPTGIWIAAIHPIVCNFNDWATANFGLIFYQYFFKQKEFKTQSKMNPVVVNYLNVTLN
jgi:hypothetical protein